MAKLVEYNPGHEGAGASATLTGTAVEATSLDEQPQLVDLSPVAALPGLKSVSCYRTAVSDLSPLAGMPLTLLNCSYTRVSDLSLLKALPLEQLSFDVRLFDEPLETLLRSLPLKQIRRFDGVFLEPAEFWREIEAGRQAALAFAAETAKLPVDEQITAVEARLKELNGDAVGPMGRVVEQGSVVEVTLVFGRGNYDLTPP